jgi:hypothetical protein
MEGQRTLSIGITVNLENYENLRLEVSGPVQNESDAEELARFLDTVLQKFGQGDPSSKERVESFRRRILPAGTQAPVPEAKATRPGEPPSVQAELEKPAVPVMLQKQEEPAKPAAAETGGSAGDLKCEVCGAPVKPAEQKMSMLFASRTLCRKCLKNM